jgi:hypothetical protein
MLSRSRFKLTVVSGCVFIVGFLCADANAAAPTAHLAGRLVTLGLIESEDRAPVPWPSGASQLSTEAILVGPGTNLADRLASRGIDPDSGAYSLVYDLNPTISKLDAIPFGSKILVPKIIESKELRQMVSSGSFLVVLSIDPELHHGLEIASETLVTLCSRFASLPIQRYTDSDNRAISVKQVEDIVGWFRHIRLMNQRRMSPPTSRDTLIALNDEARALIALLQRVVDGNQSLTKADQNEIAAIHLDLEREIKRYDDVMSGSLPDPDLPPCCTIEVSIIGGDQKTLDKLRIYYTLNGLFHTPPPVPLRSIPFPELGSGHSGWLRPKNYRIWVAPDGEPEVLLTQDALLVEVNPEEKEKKVQLRLRDPAPGRLN